MKNLSLLLITLAFFACHGNKNSAVKGVINEDNSELINEPPSFAEIISKRDSNGKYALCNAVRTGSGQLVTANHCLTGDNKLVLLSWKRFARLFERFPDKDLTIGQLVGGAAPSTLIPTYKGEVSDGSVLEAQWFDIKSGKWRKSKGTGVVHGRVLEHDLDMNPGASGSGLYLTDELGENKLVAIHLGFDGKKNRNIAILLPDVKSKTNEGLELGSYRYEVQNETCYYSYDPATDSVVTDHCTFDPNATQDSGEDSGDSDDNDNSEGGTNGTIIFPEDGTPGNPGDSSIPEPSTIQSCFNCDKVSNELARNDVFDRSCDNPDAGPNIGAMISDVSKSEVNISLGREEPYLPVFSYDPKDGKFTESLTKLAQKMIEASKWLTSATLSEKVGKLSEETVAKLKDWTDKVIRDLDDYYALVMETIKSDQVQAPSLPEVDVTEEGIESAQRYLDAVKQQVLSNPDEYFSTRMEIADSSGKAFKEARDALARGDKETAEAAMELGRGLADAVLGFAPGFGLIKDLVEAVTGHNYITKKDLTRFEIVTAWIGVFSAGYGSKVLGAAKAAALIGVAGKIAKNSSLAAKLERYGVRAKEIYDVAAKSGLKDRTRIGQVVDAIRKRLPGAEAEKLERELVDAFKRYENLPLINGKKPINGHFAGNTYFEKLPEKLKVKYPNGVTFNEKGFADFTPYAKKFDNGENFVKIEAGVSRDADALLANKAAGLNKKPADYSWHHSEETGVMQLIPTDIHNAVNHTGGYAIWGAGVKL